MKFYKICSITKRSDKCPALMIINEVFLMFKKKPHKTRYDKTNNKETSVLIQRQDTMNALKLY